MLVLFDSTILLLVSYSTDTVITVLIWVCINLLMIVLFEWQDINFHQQNIFYINYGIQKVQLSYLKKRTRCCLYTKMKLFPDLLLSDKSTYIVKAYILLKKERN